MTLFIPSLVCKSASVSTIHGHFHPGYHNSTSTPVPQSSYRHSLSHPVPPGLCLKGILWANSTTIHQSSTQAVILVAGDAWTRHVKRTWS
jgi:hypothetical protein